MHGAVLARRAARSCGRRSSGAISAPKPNADGSPKRSGPQRLLELTSNPALTNFTLPKLLWVRTHEPDAWQRVRHVLLPKDFVRLRLSGEYAIDVADASGTLMLDVAHAAGRRRCSTRRDSTRAPAAAVRVARNLRARLARRRRRETGFARGHADRRRRRRPGGGRGRAWGSRGRARSASRSAPRASCLPRPIVRRSIPKGRLHTFCHAIPGRWHVMGVTQAAGLSLRWLREQLGLADARRRGLRADDARSGRDRAAAPTACCGRRI